MTCNPLEDKGPCARIPLSSTIVGCVILLRIPHGAAHKAPLLVGYYIVSGLVYLCWVVFDC